MLLDINDAPEKSIRIFGQLIDIFEEQSINPTPLNYFIWYEYYKGDNPKFRQGIWTKSSTTLLVITTD